MAKQPWRFQGDIAYGETDPTVLVFMGEPETDVTGETRTRQDVSDPLTMKLSEFKTALGIIDAKHLRQRLADREAQRIAERESRAKAEKEANV